MTKRVAIIQSSYIPWRGYFSIIARCEALIFLDSVQFTRRDWRTRNRIKSSNGSMWLTIPVLQKGNYEAPIDSIMIAERGWGRKHLRSIEMNYRRSPYFSEIYPALEAAYASVESFDRLTLVNQGLTTAICNLLGLRTPFVRDIDLIERGRLNVLAPTGRLLELAAAVNATTYLSGPTAREYVDETLFKARGIALEWMDYTALPKYDQLWSEFDPALSIIDTLLNLGASGTRAVLIQ